MPIPIPPICPAADRSLLDRRTFLPLAKNSAVPTRKIGADNDGVKISSELLPCYLQGSFRYFPFHCGLRFSVSPGPSACHSGLEDLFATG